TGTSSRIEGIGIEVLAREALMKHQFSMQPPHESDTELRVGGEYQFRVRGEKHQLNPLTVSKLQHSVRESKFSTFREFADLVNKQNRELQMLRGMFDFKPAGQPVPIEQVEPAAEIGKGFATGARSFGSISKEAHEPLAVAMNRIAANRTQAKAAKTKIATFPTRTATCGAAPSSRWLRRASASLRITSSTP